MAQRDPVVVVPSKNGLGALTPASKVSLLFFFVFRFCFGFCFRLFYDVACGRIQCEGRLVPFVAYVIVFDHKVQRQCQFRILFSGD